MAVNILEKGVEPWSAFCSDVTFSAELLTVFSSGETFSAKKTHMHML